MSYIIWFLTLVRLAIPILILRFPLLGILVSIEADASDWIFVGVTSSEMNTIYQNWDKAMDLYGFLFIVLGRQPWEIYPFGSWSGLSGFSAHQADWILWGILLYVVPIAGFLLYIKEKVKQRAN
jgi:hypothetical protein